MKIFQVIKNHPFTITFVTGLIAVHFINKHKAKKTTGEYVGVKDKNGKKVVRRRKTV